MICLMRKAPAKRYEDFKKVSGYPEDIFAGRCEYFSGSKIAQKTYLSQTYICHSTTKYNSMTTITDDYMYSILQKTREYCIVLLKPGPKAEHPDVKTILWEHVRRNFSLRADGLLSIVCPVTIESGLSGLGIFNASVEETKKIMDEDPGVTAEIFVYETYPCRSFPGDSLPA